MLAKYFKNFFQAYFNFFLFLPYFFSVNQFLKTLFRPWKGLVAKKRSRGLNFNELFSVLSFNLISRFIGFSLRISVIFLYLILQIFFMITLPFFFLIFLLLLPFLILRDLIFPENTRKEKFKKEFLQIHVLDKKNLPAAEAWFENFYQNHILEKPWWSLEKLLSLRPIGKDWNSGYTVELDSVSTELTTPFYLSKIIEIVNRQKELAQLQELLLKERGGNVLIIGDPGVGKHTLIDALAKLIYKNKSHPILTYYRILKMDLMRIFAKFNDDAEKKTYFQRLLKEAEEAGNVILFIDSIHSFLDPNSQYNITAELMEFLNSPKTHIIGITTTFAWQVFINPQSELKKLFSELFVKEISKEKAFEFLLAEFWRYERKYKVILPYETLKETIQLSDDFLTEIPFPEKAFKLLEEVISHSLAKEIKLITPEIVKEYLKSKLNLPIELTTDFKEKLKGLEEKLKTRVLSQEEAMDEIVLSLKKAFLNLHGRKKPLASFLFLGPTGVGKTETAKALSEIFFGSQRKLARIDLGFYQTEADLSRLLGDISKKQVGDLTAKIRELKYGVLLLDELEKAHKKFLNTLLTLLDEGYIIDSTGKKIDCRYLFVIATSNVGYELFNQGKYNKEEVINYLITNGISPPEFLNRFNDVVLFKPLSFEVILAIAKRKIKNLLAKYQKEYKISFKISEEELKKILLESDWQRFGAREIDRVLLKKVESRIIDEIFQ